MDKLYLVEYGAVGLTIGHPSRIVLYEGFPSIAEAEKFVRELQYNARILIASPVEATERQ